jgi:hypothetical protein
MTETNDVARESAASLGSTTATLVKALRVLVDDIESGDGVANACIAEAADRLEALDDAAIAAEWHLRRMIDERYPNNPLAKLTNRLSAAIGPRHSRVREVTPCSGQEPGDNRPGQTPEPDARNRHNSTDASR